MNRLNYFGYTRNLKESLLKEKIGGNRPLSVHAANIVPKKGSYMYGLVYVISDEHQDYLLNTEPAYRMIAGRC
ncbi:hypothetical protein I4U23_022316 [Adineta vaga]|nr:hypothetical protein I4U23_022316 [Adineta vaga]